MESNNENIFLLRRIWTSFNLPLKLDKNNYKKNSYDHTIFTGNVVRESFSLDYTFNSITNLKEQIPKLQTQIKDPIEHLWWSFLKKYLTALISTISLESHILDAWRTRDSVSKLKEVKSMQLHSSSKSNSKTLKSVVLHIVWIETIIKITCNNKELSAVDCCIMKIMKSLSQANEWKSALKWRFSLSLYFSDVRDAKCWQVIVAECCRIWKCQCIRLKHFFWFWIGFYVCYNVHLNN